MIHEPIIPITARTPSKYLSMFHEHIIPHTARAPSKYLAIFLVPLIPISPRAPRNYVTKFHEPFIQNLPVQLANNWRCLGIQSFHIQLVFLATMCQYFMSQSSQLLPELLANKSYNVSGPNLPNYCTYS
jgi:hypothetical protein